MSDIYKKVEFDVPDGIGGTEKDYLYIRHQGVDDSVQVYNSQGIRLFSYTEHGDNDFESALKKIVTDWALLQDSSRDEFESILAQR